MDYNYTIVHVDSIPEMQGLWGGPAWNRIDSCSVSNFRQESSDHHPQTDCKLQYSEEGLYGLFKVEDRYLHCIHTEFQSDVYKDSCVEIFLEPKLGQGYFNFEFNCLGVMKASYITDPTRTDGDILGKNLTKIEDALIRRYHSIKEIHKLDPANSVTWYLEFYIPFKIFEKYCGSGIEPRNLRGNMFKCMDETSHSHWAAWSPVKALNFHAPESFGYLRYDAMR